MSGSRHQHHVGLVDGLPAGDGRAVEHDAVGEHVFVDLAYIHGDVLHLAARIGEAQVDELHVVVLMDFKTSAAVVMLTVFLKLGTMVYLGGKGCRLIGDQAQVGVRRVGTGFAGADADDSSNWR
jgi:hypothetical protein